MTQVAMSKYDAYKDSGVEWLGDIPEEWNIIKLKYTTEILKRIVGTEGHDVLSITQRGIKVKDIETGEGQLAADYSKYQIVNKGDFAMNHMDLLTGYVDISKYNGVTSPDYRVFKNISENIDDEYLLLLFQIGYNNKIFYQYGQGVSQLGRWRFPAENFRNFLIPIPSKSEQQKIVTFLNEKTAQIDEAIDIKQKQITLLKERKQIIIQNAVTKGLDPNVTMKNSGIEWIGDIPEGWEVKKLFGLCHFVRGNSSFSKDELLNNGKYVALQYGKTYKVDAIDNTYQFHVNEEFYKESQAVKFGDIILVSTSETIDDLGHSAIYIKNEVGLIGGEQLLIKPNSNLLDCYFTFYSTKVFSKLLRKYATGIKVFRFNINDLKTIYTTLPPKKEQEEIANYIKASLKQIDEAITQQQTLIEKLKEYKASLINSAVTGKIKIL